MRNYVLIIERRGKSYRAYEKNIRLLQSEANVKLFASSKDSLKF